MLTRREVILVKIEPVYGVDPVPVPAVNSVLVENPEWNLDSLRMNDRNGVRTSLGTLRKVYGGSLKGVSFDVEIKGSGAAGTAPEMDPLLRACGLGVTNVPATSDTYAPVSTGLESVTIYYYQDGTLHKMHGVVGNVTFNLEAGGIGMAKFEMVGHEPAAGMTDAALPAPTYDATVPDPAIGATFTVGAVPLITDKLEFGLNSEIAKNGDISSYDGFAMLQIVSRDVAGSYAPEAVLKAVKDFDTPLRTDAVEALLTGAIGTVAGNIFTISMPAIQEREFGPEDRNGVRAYAIGFGATEVSGDDEVSIVFT